MSENYNEQELKAVLKKYLNAESSIEESQGINSWYEAIGSADEIVPVLHHEAAKAELAGKIKTYLKLQLPSEKKTWFKIAYLKYVAASVLLISAGIGGYSYLKQLQLSARKEITVFSNAVTQKQLTLPDGSEVMLNTGSKLVIAKDFGVDSRKVTLVGEAFFKVAKDRDKPFFIRSGTLKTRVVGTSFNISAYPDLEKIKIAVMTGKVRVSESKNGKESMIAQGMVMNQTLSFYKNTSAYELKTEDTELIASWRTNKLYIDNATIKEIATQLGRYYHVKVVCLAKSNPGDRYTIRFNKESMNGVLQILSVLTKKKFIYEHNQITIK